MNESLVSHLSGFYDILSHNLSFSDNNGNYFETFDDYMAHIAKTLTQLEIIRKEPKLAIPIVCDAVFDMGKNIGECFIEDLLMVLHQRDENIYNIISGLQKNLINTKSIRTNKYYLDNEIVIICYKLRSCLTKSDKRKYINSEMHYYVSVLEFVENLNKYEKQLLNIRLKLCRLFIRLYKVYGTAIESVNVDLYDTQYISFVDIRYYIQVHRLLKNAPIQPFSKIKFVAQKYNNVLSTFLLHGNINKRNKIFFKGDSKTLAYCFSQLKKFNLLHRRDDLEIPYTDKEIANILFKTFRFSEPCSERTIYDYLRKGELARPKYPVFIIEKVDSSETMDRYNSHYRFYQPSSNLMKKKIFGNNEEIEEPY